MSINIHQLILFPGNKVNFLCTDGLAKMDIYNIDKIYNFGGKIKAKNCGIQNEYVVLAQTYHQMHALWVREKNNTDASPNFIKDLELAKDENLDDEKKLTSSELWLKWRDPSVSQTEQKFQARSQFFCGKHTKYIEGAKKTYGRIRFQK